MSSDRTFWYRRSTELALVVSLLFAAIWPLSQIRDSWFHPAGLIVPPFVSLSAAISFGISAFVLIRSFHHPSRWLAFFAYICIFITSSILVFTTGHNESPFIAWWMIIAAISGLFRRYGLMAFGTVTFGYFAYLLTTPGSFVGDLSRIIIIVIVPTMASLIIWRVLAGSAEPTKDYTELAQELNQVSNKSEIIINAIADGVIAINNAGTIQLINPAAERIMGWGTEDASELDYRSVFRLTNDKDQQLTPETDPIRHVLQTNESVARNDLTLLTGAGKKMIISLLVSPLGAIGSGAIIVFRDITSEVAENRQKAEFVSTASHEMRTPVAAIEGYISLALNPATATIDEKARSYLEKAHESATHLGQLFQDLLDVSKAEDGRISNNPEQTDIVVLIREIINPLQARAAAKGLTLNFVPDTIKSGGNSVIEPAYYASLDPSHLREVVSNIVENAIKYTKAGSVTVDVGGDIEHVIISVVDTGIGVPAEDIPHLFQKFYRVDNTDTREIGGTGLGLYLCRRLVETMNGRIWLESDYGKGSMFFVEFPRVKTEDIISKPQQSQGV